MSRAKRSKKNKIFTAFAVLVMLLGAALLLYPKITDAVYEKGVNSDRQAFEENAKSNDYSALYERLKAENDLLYLSEQADLKDPFSYSQPDIDLSQYGISDNTIGYLTIEKMGICLPVLLGSNTENLKKGATHLTKTSYPIGGENTNCVIAAHRGFAKTDMFRNIDRLKTGDRVYLENFRETLVYEVSEIEIIDPDDIYKLTIRDGEDMLTLVTCHPLRGNTQRYVVFCTRVDG